MNGLNTVYGMEETNTQRNNNIEQWLHQNLHWYVIISAQPSVIIKFISSGFI